MREGHSHSCKTEMAPDPPRYWARCRFCDWQSVICSSHEAARLIGNEHERLPDDPIAELWRVRNHRNQLIAAAVVSNDRIVKLEAQVTKLEVLLDAEIRAAREQWLHIRNRYVRNDPEQFA